MKRSLYLVLFSLVLSVGTLGAANLYDFTAVAVGIAPDGVAGNSAIQTQPLSSTTFCVGSSIVVEYATSGSGFDGSTVYSVELSDAGGSFASPTVLPQLPYPTNYFQNGTYIYVQIPGTVAPGTGYRFRVVSQSPVVLGADNGLDITITDESALTAPSLSVNGAQIFCFGTASTFIVSDATSGNLWFPGGTNTNPFIGAVLSGNYFTQISTSSGCATNSAAATIQANSPVFGFLAYFENDQLASTSDTTVSICEGDSLQIGVIIEGGQPPFDIVYTPDGFNFEFVNDVGVPYADNTFVYTQFVSDPGIYQLIGVTDAFIPPCNSQGSAGTVIVQLVPPPVTSFSYEPFCGSESGVPVAAPGFLGGGVYSFDPLPTDGATISASTGVLSGTVIGNSYTVRYTVSEGSCTDASSTTSLTVNSSDVTSFTINPFCEGADSDFPLTAPGFEGGGSYAFNPAVTDGATINPVTGIISGAAGSTTYTVQYTSPAGACQANSSTSVTTIDAPEIAISFINATCGNADGSLDATVTEGSAPYSFTWSNGATTEDISGIEAGAYTLTVTDAQGCETESAATIINQNQPELVFNSTNATCGSDNGSIDLTINNGVGPYSIVWSPGGETTEDIFGLGGGTYSAVVTDLSTTCEVSGSATILFQGSPTATFTAENTLCGQSVGSIDLNVSGGTAPITHSWSNGATTEDISGLDVGAYTDTITDANGCFTIVSVNIVNGNQFTLNATVVNPSCSSQNGGSIDLTVNGGDAPFLFSWTPNTTTVTEDVNGLEAGDYTVVVTDNAGCIDSLTSTLVPTLPLELTGVTTDATCGNSDGGVNISVNGGSGSYTFVWDNSFVTEDLTNVAAGTYTVIVGDQADANCTTSGTFTVVNGNQPEVTLTSTNTSCVDNTGSVSLTITGGSGNFTYAWSGPDGFTSNSENLTNLAAGQYNVAVTDNETTCLVNESIEVAPANAPTYTSTVVQTSCGQSNGIIDIEVTGGTEPFVVTWNGVSSSLDQTNLSAGSYAFLLIDANNCQLSETFTINSSVAPSIASEFLNPACGNDTGSVNVTLTDALSPIVFNWTKDGVDFASSEDLSSLSPGNYELLATDASGCVVSASFNLVYQNQPTLSFTSESTLCGASAGSIDLSVEGGTAPFVFEWSGPDGFSASSEDISNLAGGCYTVVLTDAATCEVTLEACVANSNAPEIVFSTIQPSCGENNGTIAPVISGGQVPYTFAWSGAEFSLDSLIDNLGNGNYILAVTDANGCESIDSVSLVNTGVPIVTGDVNDPACGVNDGSITAVVTGGLAPYSFLWSPSGSADATISGLGVGTYTVLVTDAAGCEAAGQFTLENFNGPEIAISFTNTLCGESDGSIDITVTEGSGDYTFVWTGAGVDVASEDQNGLAAGAYVVLVTDNLTGCEATSTVEIENSNQPILTLISVGTLCGASSGSVELTVSNAVNPTFSWTGPNGFTASTEDINELITGVYTVTVTDGACEVTGSVSVSPTKSVWSQNVNIVAGSQYTFEMFVQNVIASSPAQLRVFVGSSNLGAITPTGVTTWSQFTASFTATTSGLTEIKIVNENLAPSGNDFGLDDISLVEVCPATPPPGSTCGTNIIVNGDFEAGNVGFLSQYTFVANGPANNELIPEGRYSVAANANTLHPQFQGTGRSGNFMVVNGNEPENPVLSFSTVGSSCDANNGSINLTVSNFTIPITYNWSGPNGFTAASQDINNLAAGVYNVEVTSGACSETGSATVGFSNLPVLALAITPADCGTSNGTVDLTITNAASPIVSWTGPDGFTATTEDLTDLAEGLYFVTVTQGACVVEDSANVVTDEPQVAVEVVPTSCSAPSGSINITVSNANNPSFSWTGPDGFAATTEDITNLSAGTYTVTVTDGECIVEETVVVDIDEPTLAFSSVPSPCGGNSGSINLTVANASNPSFSWTGPDGFAATTEDLSGLAAGVYNVTVTDGACIVEGSATVTSDEPTLAFNATSSSCGGTTGTIDLTVTNGANPTFSWTGPDGFAATTEDLSSLATGIYNVTVTDGACVVQGSATVTSEEPTLTFNATPSSCDGSTGTIDLTVTNGANPTFSWTGPDGFAATTEDLSGLAAGIYNVTVTDGACVVEGSATITSDEPTLAFNATPSSCGATTGTIDLTVTNGANPTFSWTGPDGFAATTEDLSGLAAGLYNVTLTDGACVVEGSATITSDEPTLAFNATPSSCGGTTGTIDLTVTNGTNPTFSWTGPDGFAATTEDLSGLAAGVYNVTVTDGACVVDGSATIISNNPSVSLTSVPATCGLLNGSIDLTISNASNPSFSWTGPAGFTSTLEDLSALEAGLYNVTVTDGSCIVEESTTITSSGSAITATLTSTGTTCGLCNGSAEVTVTSGVGPFTYQWSSGASVSNPSTLCAGDAVVTITDPTGCSAEFTVSIAPSTAPVVTFTQTPSTCGNAEGSIDVSVDDAVEPYVFVWNGPNLTDVATEDLTALEAGTYTLEFLDANLCTASISVTITNSNEPVVAVTSTGTLCGQSTGAIDITVSNASNPSFSWTGPNGFAATTEDLTGLAAGDYSVTVTDGDCIVEETASVINTNGPTASIAAAAATICPGVDVELTISFTGTAPYTFTYTDGSTPVTISGYDASQYVVTVSPTVSTTYTLTDVVSDSNPDCEGSFIVESVAISISTSPVAPSIAANGPLGICEGQSVVLTSSAETGNIWNITGPDQFNQSITVTEEGSYFVVVLNEFGCTDTSNTLDVDVLPSGLELAFNDTTVCAGTSIQLIATDGDNYLWSPSVYLSTILNGTTTCTPFETTTYIVTGSNACGEGSDTVTVTVNPIASTDLGSDLTLCQNTPLTLSVQSEVGVTYNWGPSSAIIGQTDSSSAQINTVTTTDVYLQTTNTNGCVFTDTIAVNIENPVASFNISALGATTFCQGDNVVLQATTGNLVVWSNGLENFDQILVDQAGDYFAVYNGSNCPVYSDTISVSVTPLPAVAIIPQGSLTVCEGTCASLQASETSGITWTLADGSTSNEATIDACVNGWYILSRTENACIAVDSVFVTVTTAIQQPTVTLDGSNIICQGQTTSTLISSYATGNQWLLNGNPIDGATSNTLVLTVGGLYSVVVSSSSGCSSTSATVEIIQKSTDPIQITAADTVVCNNETINIVLTASQGFVSYTWFGNGEAGETYTATYIGEYSVVGVNEDGCQSTDYINIVGNVPFEVEAVSPVYYDDFNVSYAGAQDGSIEVNVTGGSGSFSYSWSNGSNAEDLSGLSGGDYTLTVSDQQGCSVITTINVNEPGLVKLPNGFTPNGDGFNDFYVITGIQGYEGNQINIFNRWGSLVYSAKEYQNNWDGTSNDGNLLPDGTYFIVVNLNKEGYENVQSYIDIKRN